ASTRPRSDGEPPLSRTANASATATIASPSSDATYPLNSRRYSRLLMTSERAGTAVRLFQCMDEEVLVVAPWRGMTRVTSPHHASARGGGKASGCTVRRAVAPD